MTLMSDHLLYCHDLNVWFRVLLYGEIMKMSITLRDYKEKLIQSRIKCDRWLIAAAVLQKFASHPNFLKK